MLNTKQLRAMRRNGEFDTVRPYRIPFKLAIMAFLATIISILMVSCVHAATGIVNVNKLANAIYMAEGGSKTKHPYGILKRYKVTTPRQACINTIKSNLKRWDGKGDFIVFLGKTYCPIGAKNDPTGLNKNWVKNVRYYYDRT